MTEKKTKAKKPKAKKPKAKKPTKKPVAKKAADDKATKTKAADERQSYEAPLIERIDLPGLSNNVLDDAGTPLLAQESSNINSATMFPPPPTPP